MCWPLAAGTGERSGSTAWATTRRARWTTSRKRRRPARTVFRLDRGTSPVAHQCRNNANLSIKQRCVHKFNSLHFIFDAPRRSPFESSANRHSFGDGHYANGRWRGWRFHRLLIREKNVRPTLTPRLHVREEARILLIVTVKVRVGNLGQDWVIRSRPTCRWE